MYKDERMRSYVCLICVLNDLCMLVYDFHFPALYIAYSLFLNVCVFMCMCVCVYVSVLIDERGDITLFLQCCYCAWTLCARPPRGSGMCIHLCVCEGVCVCVCVCV